jgi:hypothetical protein
MKKLKDGYELIEDERDLKRWLARIKRQKLPFTVEWVPDAAQMLEQALSAMGGDWQLRVYHKMAEQCPTGSDERLKWLEKAHAIFMEPKRRGPRKKTLEDGEAIHFMLETGWRSAEHISAHRLAEMAVDMGMAANRGGRDAKIQRLERSLAKHPLWRDLLEKHGRCK